MTRDAIICMLRKAELAGQVLEPEMLALLPAFERFANLAIADFLERTGQYVTNDASREAALAQARAEEREALLAEVETGIWFDKSTEEVLESLAAAIRARGEKGGA